MTAYMDHKDLANEVIEQSRAREITDGVHRVLDRIAEAESVAGREAGSVHLLAATKTRDVGETIESGDSIELAEKIARRATMRGITVGVLLEVNESGEESKSGCAPSHAIDLAQRIGAMGGLRLQGLMTIGAHVDDERTIRAGFAHLRRTRDQILASGAEGTADCTELSMGMTHDMTYAIEEGSTIVRVGTAIFGERAFI